MCDYKHFTCPCCQHLLFDPVITQDGTIYNKTCAAKINNTQNVSPIKWIRTMIIDLVKYSNIFDNNLQALTVNQMIEYNLVDDLISCPKISQQQVKNIVEHR